MAKKIVARTVAAREDVAALVDRGAQVDVDLKNLGMEDKGIKARICEFVSGEMVPGEMSVRVEGEVSAALVGISEKYEIDASRPEFGVVAAAIRSGMFGEAVAYRKSLVVPPDKVEAAMAILQSAGLPGVSIESSLDVNPEGFRVLASSTHSDQAMATAVDALKGCVVRKVSNRVSYGAK